MYLPNYYPLAPWGSPAPPDLQVLDVRVFWRHTALKEPTGSGFRGDCLCPGAEDSHATDSFRLAFSAKGSIMNPFFTVITPTINRPELEKACRSLASQSYRSWQHVVVHDEANFVEDERHPQRLIIATGERRNDFGNTPRNMAWMHALGTYLICLDDDNYLADDEALARVYRALMRKGFPEVAIIPCTRFNQRAFPPDMVEVGHVDTANLVVKREIGQWPVSDKYEQDGLFIADLCRKYRTEHFPELQPIIAMPAQRRGL